MMNNVKYHNSYNVFQKFSSKINNLINVFITKPLLFSVPWLIFIMVHSVLPKIPVEVSLSNEKYRNFRQVMYTEKHKGKVCVY